MYIFLRIEKINIKYNRFKKIELKEGAG